MSRCAAAEHLEGDCVKRLEWQAGVEGEEVVVVLGRGVDVGVPGINKSVCRAPVGDGGQADTAGSSQQGARTSRTTLGVHGLATEARRGGAAIDFCPPPQFNVRR